jgi:hypothetical protein
MMWGELWLKSSQGLIKRGEMGVGRQNGTKGRENNMTSAQQERIKTKATFRYIGIDCRQ